MRLKLVEAYSENLLLRDTADTLFDTIEKTHDEEIVIDYEGVRSITRAFAHQYILRKRMCRKKVIEENMSEEIRQMFEIVSKGRKPAKHVLPPTQPPIYLSMSQEGLQSPNQPPGSAGGSDEWETTNT
ncbi:MAG: hypothetical protein QW318_03500 [Candidatus Caldarchaeum sp.]|jgi:hypothetical protein|uniref:DUF4325 domain-containing protein n=1 Tax=Caldiarchaeum subterraneum TaxID=311458 RepID=A0A7J3G4H2_CALS0